MPEFGRGAGRGMRGGRGRGGGEDYLDPEHEQFRKLFIGGLSYETSTEGLKSHFEKWGEVVDCIVMKEPNTKKSRGFGFITFKEASMLNEAQKCRPHKIDGREVESKRAMPREESGRSESQQSVTKLFIGGVKDDTTEEQLRSTFGLHGDIEKIDLITDRTTGKVKGFSFVTFKDYDSVDKCVLIKKHDLNGRMVEVKKAENKDGSGSGRGRGGMVGGGRGGGMGQMMGMGGMGRGGNWGSNQGYNGGYGQGGYGGGGTGGSGYGGGYGNQGGGGGNFGSSSYGNSWGGGGGGGYDSGYGGGYNQGGGGGGGGGGNWGGGGDGGYGSGYGNTYGAGYGGGSGGGTYGGSGGNYGGGGGGGGNYGGGGGNYGSGSGNYGGYRR